MLLGVAAVAVLAFKVSGSAGTGGDVFRIEAKFENVGGLNEKAPVMVGGVRVGRVAEIRIDKEDYSAVVGMDIDSHYDNLPIDSGASILTAGLLGAQFVGLEPGADDIFLEQGDEIEITQSAIQLETLISQFMFSQGSDNKADSE
ncbi:MAG: outer membrane lipid asymmetry maintenance protein MlaD [Acidiferrobacterales bacterium]|nr:outer membrane lipid asymmetry maintenance protein MlaD [Acidiferrobacterales bacterium]